MASIQELTAALRDHLESKGVLDQVRATLRAEVFATIHDKASPAPRPSNENYLLNELIREYLEFNHYAHSASTFEAESGNDKTPLDRAFLGRQLGVAETDETRGAPLLCALVFGRRERPAEPPAEPRLPKPKK